jgi:uncharacterized protein YgiM (DUF1202 family)
VKNLVVGIVAIISVCISHQKVSSAQSMPSSCNESAYSNRFSGETIRSVCDLIRLQQSQPQPQTPPRIRHVWTVKDEVNLRTGASASSGVVMVMPIHTILQVHSTRDGWAWVTLKDTETHGWVSVDMIGVD